MNDIRELMQWISINIKYKDEKTLNKIISKFRKRKLQKILNTLHDYRRIKYD